MTSIKMTRLVLMVFLGILLTASSAYSNLAITDSGHPNLIEQSAIYDHRNSNTWTESALGAEGVSGGYFDVSVGVITGYHLSNHSDVISVKVKHLETGFQFSLQPDVCEDYLGSGMQAWSLFLRPEEWMFEGNWEFTMRYKGRYGYVRKQIVSVATGPKVFPAKPSHIQIVKSTSSITVSWSALGNPYVGTPNNPIDYRIQAYDDNGVCPVIVFRGKWSGSDPDINVGTYDPILNKVTFSIPLTSLDWSGHRIRLENRIRVYTGGLYSGQGKAVEELILP
jgi:hypothetical protein